MNPLKIAFFAVLLLAAACTEPIDLDLNSGEFKRLVVDAWLTNETKAHEVKLTLTTDYLAEETPAPATGATVAITDGTETINLQELEPGRYFTPENVSGKPGHTYTLNIEYDGENYSAISTLHPVAPIDSLGFHEEEDFDTDDDYGAYSITLYTTEPAGEGDHYFWKAYPTSTPDDQTRTFWEIAEDRFVDGNDIGGAEIIYVDANPGDVFTLEQYRITKEAFDFFLAIQYETVYRGGLYDTPPANVPSNVSNGAVGFFVTAAVERGEVSFE